MWVTRCIGRSDFFKSECAPRPTLTGRVEPNRLFFSKYLYYRVLGDTYSYQGQKTRSQTSKGLAVSALRARPSSFQKTRSRRAASITTRVNPTRYTIPCFRSGPDGAPCAPQTAPSCRDHPRECAYGSPAAQAIDIDSTRHAGTTKLTNIIKAHKR